MSEVLLVVAEVRCGKWGYDEWVKAPACCWGRGDG